MKSAHIQQWQLGAVRITRIVEIAAFVDPPGNLFVAGSPEGVKRHSWLRPHHSTDDGKIILAFQAFLIEAPGLTGLVDTCLGSDKTREHAVFEGVQSRFLEDLESVGAFARDLDFIVCTHLHHDHVGWNTRRLNGKWVPTFPNARYLFGREEWAAWQSSGVGNATGAPHLLESVQPIIDAGLVEFVASDHRVCDEISLEPTPGHTPGHVCVRIESNGEVAVITGDVMHHPIQCAEPDWRTHFCCDPEMACVTRRRFLEKYENRRALIIGSHFADPTVGWIIRDGETWRFTST